MGQIVIVYYSETGNTEAMANMVAKGVEAAGATAKVLDENGVRCISANLSTSLPERTPQ